LLDGERTERHGRRREHQSVARGGRPLQRVGECVLSPVTVSGVASGRAAASVEPPWLACGASTRLPRIASIGVASTTLPPYSPIASESAPMLRGVPDASAQ
jgi:hypothetical protein